MTPSLTIERDGVVTDDGAFEDVTSTVVAIESDPTSRYRSRRELLSYTTSRLLELAKRQGATRSEPYSITLRLVAALVGSGSATPQVADNGDGGIEVLWLVNGTSLTLDYEDQFEILLTAVGPDGTRLFAYELTAYWTPGEEAIMKAHACLRAMSSELAHPIALI